MFGGKTPAFVVNKALNFGERIFLEFYRQTRDSATSILNDFSCLRKI